MSRGTRELLEGFAIGAALVTAAAIGAIYGYNRGAHEGAHRSVEARKADYDLGWKDCETKFDKYVKEYCGNTF